MGSVTCPNSLLNNEGLGTSETAWPSLAPSTKPTLIPASVAPSTKPSLIPSVEPNFVPSTKPTFIPSIEPSVGPYTKPTLIPTNMPSMAPSSKPSFIPSAVPVFASACFCHRYDAVLALVGFVLCYNNTKPNEYFGVYTSLDILFSTNLIIKNPNFPSNSVVSVCGGAYDNSQPLTSDGVAFLISIPYIATSKIYDSGSNVKFQICGGLEYVLTDMGSVTCPNSVLNNEGLGTSETA